MVKLSGLGLVTVAAAATPAPISATQIITPNASIQAPATNSGNIRIGTSNIASGEYAGELRPGESMEVVGPLLRGIEEEFDLAEIYIEVDEDGDGAIVGYWSRSI